MGEVGFPAVDPGAPAGPNWGAYDEGTSDLLQASMQFRVLATLFAAGVYRAFPYTFNFGPVDSSLNYPDNAFTSWLQFDSTGLHNDIDYADRTPFEQATDCWPRPAWFAVRRFRWLLSLTGRDPNRSFTVVVNNGSLTILQMSFASAISTGPDGAALADTWTGAYLVWVDQVGALDVATISFGFPGGFPATPYELLPLFPVVEPDSVAGPNGYNAGTTDYAWAFDAAKDPTEVRSSTTHGRTTWSELTLTILRCDPAAKPAVLAPLCILTNGVLRGYA